MSDWWDMRTIAIYNQKGGVGKTTTTVNVGASLAERGRCVLLVDLDPQGSASRSLGVEDGADDVAALLSGERGIRETVRETGVPGVWIVSGGGQSAAVERMLSGKRAGADRTLRRKLREVDRIETGRDAGRDAGNGYGFDYVLIDCPPNLGLLSVNGLLAADGVIVPVEAHALSLVGLAAIREALVVIREEAEHDLHLDGVLVCRYSRRTRHAREVAEEIREHFGESVFQTVIRENVRLAEAPSFGEPVTVYAPTSTGAEDYRALAVEIIGRSEIKGV